jgi:Asp-tRNA(Asn)/Glu-tRNA(Gln) amidotransferase A subunit family amidase
LVAAFDALAGAPGGVGAQQPDIVEITIGEAHAAMRAGQLRCRDLVQGYLDRIEAYDQRGPSLNAI